MTRLIRDEFMPDSGGRTFVHSQDATRFSRRTALGLILAASGASLLAACGPAAPQQPPQPTAAPKPAAAPAGATVTAAKPAAQAQIKKGGTLRWGQVGDIVTTDAFQWAPTANNTTGAVNETLIDYADDLTPTPRLAESWEQSTDLTKIKINLRKGVTFHTGRELTSDDIEYNLLRARDFPKNPFASQVAPGSAWWKSWEKPDKNTIVLQSDAPRPGVFDFLQYLRILDKDTMEGPDAATKVVGTGSMMWKEWVPGDHITLTKNPNYWDSGRPYLDGIDIKIFRDAQSMVAALEAGALDVADLIPIPDAARLKTDTKYKMYETHDLGQYFYGIVNAGQPPTDNKMLRQAINYAIDRQRFVDNVLKGFGGEVRALPWAKSSPAFDPSKNKMYAYDLDKAKSLVQQSGLSNIEFDISWATAGYQAEYQALATIIQGDLAKIGVKTNLKPTDPPTFTAQGNGNNPPYNGMRLSAGAFAQLYEASSLSTLSRTFGYLSNLGGFYDDKFKALVASAATEPDAAKRKQLYSQYSDFLLDASYGMVICPYPDIDLMRPNVEGLRWTLATNVPMYEVWLS